MDYKKYIKNQIDEFSAKGFKRTFTPVYRFKDTFPFTKIDFNNIEEAIIRNHDYQACAHLLESKTGKSPHPNPAPPLVPE